MTSKTNIAYNHVFIFLIQIMDDNNIDCNFWNKIITTDYEKALRNSIKKILKPKNLRGCFFHYSKAIWKKCREYGLAIKKFREESTIYTFCLKITHLYIEIIKMKREKLENFAKNKDIIFMKFFKYFKKNWMRNKNFYFHENSGKIKKEEQIISVNLFTVLLIDS